MSANELCSLMAAQIFAALSTHLPQSAPESMIKSVAETAVKCAKAVEEAVAQSLPVS